MSAELLGIEKEISFEHRQLLSENSEIADAFSTQLDCWEKSTEFQLKADFPFYKAEAQCVSSERLLELGQFDIEEYKKDLKYFEIFMSEAKLPRDMAYWQQAISKSGDVTIGSSSSTEHVSHTVRTLLLQTWRKMLDRKRSEWEIETIKKYREQYLKVLDEWLEELNKIVKCISNLGLEPGYFLDFSKGQLSVTDIDKIKKWASYLAEDNGVKELCELLGKLRQLDLSEKIELAKTVVSIPVTTPHGSSREEIVGVKLGRDIENLLPSELALLADTDTSILFDLKYIESRLMCFDMEGQKSEYLDREIEKEQQVKEETQKGPMIICVDTSGSMHGSPETIAKAVTMYLASSARQEKRACYLINYSTDIEVLDLSAEDRLQTLLSFLSMSFYGGTDAAPAIEHGLKVMANDDYSNADLLIISDFVMSTLSHSLLSSIQEQKLSGNRFYSLCIGNEFMSKQLRSHFDREWIYNPANSSIRELTEFQNSVTSRKTA